MLGLENWGAFVLQRAGTNRTRFIIRTSGSGAGSWAAVVLAPMGLLVFEPAHFIMQRKMMAEVKRRAERGWAATAEETDPLVSTSAP